VPQGRGAGSVYLLHILSALALGRLLLERTLTKALLLFVAFAPDKDGFACPARRHAGAGSATC
jgi:hypothetical protein